MEILKEVAVACGGPDKDKSMHILSTMKLQPKIIQLLADLPKGECKFDKLVFKACGKNYKVFKTNYKGLIYKLKIKLLDKSYTIGELSEYKILSGSMSMRKWSVKFVYNYGYVVISGRIS